MIKNTKPLSMAESKKYLSDKPELMSFMKNFISLDEKEAKLLRTKLEELNFMQLNEKNISGLIDILPKDKKILNEVSAGINLNEDETNKVLQTIKEYI